MQITIGPTQTHYTISGRGPAVVLLHGWGCDGTIWAGVVNHLSDSYTLIVPDLPGFGNSTMEQQIWSSHEYEAWLSAFCQGVVGATAYAVVGHSFGGKLAALHASHRPAALAATVIIDASGLPLKLTPKEALVQAVASLIPSDLKALLGSRIKKTILQKMGVANDYQKATPHQQAILKKVVREDISAALTAITSPTCIMWGKHDDATPLTKGNEFAQLINNSHYVVFEKSGHYPFIDESTFFARQLRAFLSQHHRENGKLKRAASSELALSITSGTASHVQSPNRTTLLAILQQLEYDVTDFRQWVTTHANFFGEVEPERWTPKLLIIKNLSRCFFWQSPPERLIRATQTLWPLEQSIKQGVIRLAKMTLRRHQQRGLKVVAIAGSYGKTSTKHILHHVLGSQLQVLVTPYSYNTPLGISRVILRQLARHHQVLVVELGEYNPDDIQDLLNLTQPDYGILTPIGHQHLERFGSLKALTQMFENFLDFFQPHPTNLLVAEENKLHYAQRNLTYYGTSSQAAWRIVNPQVSRRGTDGRLETPEGKYDIFTPLFGAHALVNSLPSFWLGRHLHLPLAPLLGQVATQPYLERRHEPHYGQHNVLVLDNSFNTNPEAAAASLALLSQLPASKRLMVTAGFVELGDKTDHFNHQFGKQAAKVVDYLALQATPWTAAIVDGFVEGGGKKSHVMIGADFNQALTKLHPHTSPNAIVLFEGGYRERYA